MNRLLRVMLIICITILLSVHNLCAQEVWEELAEQLMDEDENSSFQWDTHFEELSELRENPININTALDHRCPNNLELALAKLPVLG